MASDRFSTAARFKAIGEQAQARVYRATGRQPDGRPVRRNRLTGRAALLALTVCALVVALAYPTRQYLAQRSQIADQRQQAQQAQQQVERLREQKARWSDPDFVKAQAREQLHFVMPDESGYTMLGQHGSGSGDDQSSDASANRPWYDNVWDGVNSADAQH
ncbi:septum formation initiator family protein [Streptomyces sp. RB6PN25]|uniref:Septum formation initiator family protein n=1 Tax=Streptomyces humicola TaxID=2953240 RepID=A0ABT1PTQ9_9ACTN|nr:cell division protein FtsL [Streptomyces humicola]MCQ4080513.1 septum formation initiator family protein [Streptomyces humicola]